jgi:hypothetical protein
MMNRAMLHGNNGKWPFCFACAGRAVCVWSPETATPTRRHNVMVVRTLSAKCEAAPISIHLPAAFLLNHHQSKIRLSCAFVCHPRQELPQWSVLDGWGFLVVVAVLKTLTALCFDSFAEQAAARAALNAGPAKLEGDDADGWQSVSARSPGTGPRRAPHGGPSPDRSDFDHALPLANRHMWCWRSSQSVLKKSRHWLDNVGSIFFTQKEDIQPPDVPALDEWQWVCLPDRHRVIILPFVRAWRSLCDNFLNIL